MKDGNTNVLSLSMLWTGVDGNKWMYDAVHQTYPLLPGHLDDVVKFALLPSNLATPNLMSAIGKTVSNPAGDGVVVCGSVGEISNNPSYGDGFQYAWDHYKDDLDVAFDMVEQRHTVWAYLALKAPDQLRQRMAWALSQICVVGFAQLDDLNTESLIQYYDIFVRHAFGSYRDIMKKVAFSEAMATFLSSKENKSYQYSRSRNINAFPDENFAREVCSLWS
jgi:cullin-associated NEDD8-dissociated protein 1